jgi:hypothetical protein
MAGRRCARAGGFSFLVSANMPEETVVVAGTRYVVSPLTLQLILYLAKHWHTISGSGQFVIDHGENEFTPRHTQVDPKVRVS